MKNANLTIAIIYTVLLAWMILMGVRDKDGELVFGTIIFAGPVIVNWLSWDYLNKHTEKK